MIGKLYLTSLCCAALYLLWHMYATVATECSRMVAAIPTAL